MADLFLSYAREDRDCAELLARALAARGWSVWWDRQIHVGQSFSTVIERELDRAKCVIVLWSRHSLASDWVQNEASEAARKNILVPVRIEDVRPPLEFRRLQTADVFDWRNGFSSPQFDACITSIELLVGNTASRPLPSRTQAPAAPPPPPPNSGGARPPAQHYPQPPYGQHPAGPYAPRVHSGAVIPNYLIPAILVTIGCCLPLGIVAVINAAQVNSRLAAGDEPGARRASETAKLWTSIAFGVGFLAWFFYLALMGSMFSSF